MTVVLAGTLPEPERNGLADLTERLIDDQTALLTLVVTVGVATVQTSSPLVDAPTKVKLIILDVEPIEGEERAFVEAAARHAREIRTGRRALPGHGRAFGTVFDPDVAERIIRQFAEEQATALDPETGELSPLDPDARPRSPEVTVDRNGVVLTPREVAELTGRSIADLDALLTAATTDPAAEEEWLSLRNEAAAVQAERDRDEPDGGRPGGH